MKKILVTGAAGMLASDFQKYAAKYFDIISFDKIGLDITNFSDTKERILEMRPDCVLNCAAYTDVNNAEGDGKKICYDVNTFGVQNLARITAQENIDFITLSTDYVFDGKKSDGYLENDVCHPLNHYGRSKYEGECLALHENRLTIIVRTSWLYGGGAKYKNFVNTVLRLAQTEKEIKMVDDVFGSPTNCADLVRALMQVLNTPDKYRGKILHFSNDTAGENVSWYDFAEEILAQIGKDTRILHCSHETYSSPAKRPLNSRLMNKSDIILRDWKDGVGEYIDTHFRP